MKQLNEKDFEKVDNTNLNYSAKTVPLQSNEKLAIRKNFLTGAFEIFRIRTKTSIFSHKDINAIRKEASQMEGS